MGLCIDNDNAKLHRVEDGAKPLLALVERFFCLFSFGDAGAGICQYTPPPGKSRNFPGTLIKDETQSEVYMGVGVKGDSYATMATGKVVKFGKSDNRQTHLL